MAIYWKDYRQMCAVKFLRLEDFLDDQREGMAVHLEPQGILFAKVCWIWWLMSNRGYIEEGERERWYNYNVLYVNIGLILRFTILLPTQLYSHILRSSEPLLFTNCHIICMCDLIMYIENKNIKHSYSTSFAQNLTNRIHMFIEQI